MTTEVHTMAISNTLLILEITPTNWRPKTGHPMAIRRAVLTVARNPAGRNQLSDMADYSGTLTAKYERDYSAKLTSDYIWEDLGLMAGFNLTSQED